MSGYKVQKPDHNGLYKTGLFAQVAILLEVGRPLFYNGFNVMGIFRMYESRRRLAWKVSLGGRLKFKLKPTDFTGAFQT